MVHMFISEITWSFLQIACKKGEYNKAIFNLEVGYRRSKNNFRNTNQKPNINDDTISISSRKSSASRVSKVSRRSTTSTTSKKSRLSLKSISSKKDKKDQEDTQSEFLNFGSYVAQGEGEETNNTSDMLF